MGLFTLSGTKNPNISAQNKIWKKLIFFSKIRGHKVLQNIILPNGNTIQCLVVGYFGILAVTVNGLGGEIYGNAKDTEWVQINKENKQRFENPVTVNQKNIEELRKLLGKENIYKIPIENAVVFTGKKTTVYTDCKSNVYTEAAFKKILNSTKLEKDCGADVEKIYNVLIKLQK